MAAMAERDGEDRVEGVGRLGRLGQPGRRAWRGISAVLMALVASAMLAGAAGIVLLHVGFSPVLTGSMRGTFDPGAVILTRRIAVGDVKPGDIVVFRPPGQTEAYAHRVATVTTDPAGPVITTKGDANPAPDSWHAQLTGPTASKVVFSVPHLGTLLVALHRPPFRTLALLLASVGFTTLIGRAVYGRLRSAPTALAVTTPAAPQLVHDPVVAG